jgi:hypothetical protein
MLVIQLTRSGAVISDVSNNIPRLREQFDREQCVLFPRLIESGLLHTIQRRIDGSEFRPFIHEGIGHDSNLVDEFTVHLLFFLTNEPRFLQIVRDITGCTAIAAFHGRVYRMDPAASNLDSWHDDMLENRLIGMSLNLSKDVFRGAVFQLRDRYSKRILHETANTGFGDAIIFKLADHLQHRNTDVAGAAPKTAFAGWFRSHQPDYHSWVRIARKNEPPHLG